MQYSALATTLSLVAATTALGPRAAAAAAPDVSPLPPSMGATFFHPRAESACGGTNHLLCDPSQDIAAAAACNQLITNICDPDADGYTLTAEDATSYELTVDGQTCQIAWSEAVGKVYLGNLCTAAVAQYNGCLLGPGLGGAVSIDVDIQGNCVTQCLGQPGQECPKATL